MNFTTLAHTDSDDPYLYHNYEIEFSDQILADADGKTRTIKYGYSIPTAQARKGARLDSDGNAILRIVNQRIPDSDEAEELLRKSTNVFQPGSNLHQLLSEDPDIDFSEYEDEEIILQSGGSCTMIKEAVSCFLNFYVETGDLFVVCYDNACLGDGYGNPEPDPDPPPLPPGPDPGEGGGGSGTPPGDSGSEADICNDPTLIMIPPSCQEEDDEEEEEEAESPCDDENPPEWCENPCPDGIELSDGLTLNSPLVMEVMYDSWNGSNAEASNPFDRLERGGVFVEYLNGGFDFIPLPSEWSSPCEIDSGNEGLIIPDNAVIRTWIHTHPFELNEPLYACIDLPFLDIETLYIDNPEALENAVDFYTGGPSEEDILLHKNFESVYGSGLKGIMIDKNGIVFFDGETNPDDSETWERIEPCAYTP